MVRAGRVTRCRPDARIFFFDQVFIGKRFIFYITPIFCSCFIMQQFRKCFCQPVCQRLQRDLAVVVVLFLKLFDMRLYAVNGYGESADEISPRDPLTPERGT